MDTGGLVICRPRPIPYRGGETRGLTLISDLHIGAAQIDYQMISQELAEAQERGDRIAVNGDVFDAIIAKDPRFSPDVMHTRLNGKKDPLNHAIDWAFEIFEPVADQLDMIGVGNHDVTSERYGGLDLVKMLVYRLQEKVKAKGHVIHYGGYGGFLDYRFRDDSKHAHRFVIYYHHGSGGAAPVTKGLIDMNRKSTGFEADLLWMGHKHSRLTAAVQMVSCPQVGDDPTIRDVRHVITGSYFDTYKGQSQMAIRRHGRRSNYAADMGLAPQGKGGARVELRFGRDNDYVVKVIQ